MRRAADGGVGRERLARVHVERGAGDRSRFQRGGESRKIDDLATRAVHDDRGLLHLRERVGVDEVARLLGERCVQRDDVRGAEQLVELHQLRSRGARARLRRERVVRDDAHLEAGRPARDLRANTTDADEAQRLAAQLAADELRARPLAGADAAVRVGDAPQQRQCERDRVFGRGHDVAERCVHDVHAVGGRRGDVDVVHANAGAADHRETRSGIEDLRRHFRLAAHDERVDIREARREIGLVQAGRDANVTALAEQDEAVLRERVGHMNDGSGLAYRRVPTVSARAPARAPGRVGCGALSA